MGRREPGGVTLGADTQFETARLCGQQQHQEAGPGPAPSLCETLCAFFSSVGLSCMFLQAEFCNQMVKLKEFRQEKDEVLEGGWYTEERMATDLKYSPILSFNNRLFSLLPCRWLAP